MKNKYY